MGSSPAHFCGPPKPPSGARGRDHGAHVPRISRPPPSRFVFLYRWLPPLAGHDWHVLSINRAGRFTDASFGLDHRSARSIGTRFRPLTRFFGANEQRHRVEHRPLLRTAQAPIWRPRMRSTGRASLGLAALPFSIFCFFTGGYLVWPGTIGTRARSTGPVVLTDAFSVLLIEAHGPLVRDSGLSPDFLGQMTSLMGSSPAHCCGRRSPHLARWG